MPQMNFGDKMPKTYFEAYKPAEGVAGRAAILSVRSLVGMQRHWVDNTNGGTMKGLTRGMYVCSGGVCCQSGFWNPIQVYAFPLWVYVDVPTPRNPGSNAGVVQILSISAKVYDQLVALADNGVDLENVDLLVQSVPQGNGSTIQVSTLPDTLLPKQFREQMVAEMPDLVGQIERSLGKPCSEAEWEAIVNEAMTGQPANLGNQNQGRTVVRQANPGALFGGNALPQGAPNPHGALPYGAPPAQPAHVQPGAHAYPGANTQPAQARPGPAMQTQARPAPAMPFGAPHPGNAPLGAAPGAGVRNLFGGSAPAAPHGAAPAVPHGVVPQGVPPQGVPPQGFAQPGVPPQGFPPQATPFQGGVQPVDVIAQGEQVMSEGEVDALLGGQ